MKFKLTKRIVKTVDFKPYGRFTIKFLTGSGGNNLSPRTIPFSELKMEDETAMPFTKEQEKEFVKFLKQNKTDIVTDGSYFGFYTRTNYGYTRVFHPKLQQYREDEGFKSVVNGD